MKFNSLNIIKEGDGYAYRITGALQPNLDLSINMSKRATYKLINAAEMRSLKMMLAFDGLQCRGERKNLIWAMLHEGCTN